MRGQHHEVQDLCKLTTLQGDELRAAFRRALANLAAQAAQRAFPLEGLDSIDLLASVRHALAHGLFQDLSWLSASSAALAVYELMSVLPASEERNHLNQAVSAWLADADANTFVTLATALARGTRDGLSSPDMRSRTSLALSLPIGVGVRVDELALALISQPDHVRDWVDKPSQGSLPSRRLAARLLERAAREASRRAAQRDDSGIKAIEQPLVRAAWDRLLADRESLVWRHVAVARGLLSVALPRLGDEIKAALDPELTPTEWRRGAASLAASMAVAARPAATAIQPLLVGSIVQKDPGVAAAMMFGLPRAAEAEPQLAVRLLPALLRLGGVPAAEAYLELLDEQIGPNFGHAERPLALKLLKDQLNNPEVRNDDTTVAAIEWLMQRLSGGDEGEGSVDRAVATALRGFVDQGAAAALSLAKVAIESAQRAFACLEASDTSTPEGRAASVGALAELDLGLLTGSTLTDLVALGEDQTESLTALHELFEQFGAWLIASEQTPIEHASRITHPTLRMRRVRTLLHLVDADGAFGSEQAWLDTRKTRRQRTVRVLLNRALREAQSPLRRAVFACLARAFDALVRDEVFEFSDVILCASLYLHDADDVATLSEACMVPELQRALLALSELSRRTVGAADNLTSRRDGIRAVQGLVSALPATQSPRVSVLRSSLQRVQLALEGLYAMRAQAEVVDDDGGLTIDELGDALQTLAQLVLGTRKRLSPNAQVGLPSVGQKVRALGDVFEQALAARDPQRLTLPMSELDGCATAELPSPVATVTLRVVAALRTLPLEAAPAAALPQGKVKRISLSGTEAESALPNWVPANRMLGGFYVLHALGEGGVGSVFVARRSEERDDPKAEVFALKVPEYNGEVAHVLSEADFLRMFREEAGALLALPDDAPNLARFVTFDAGIKPKPILVMEHVEGPSLERLMTRRQLDVTQAFDVLEGVASGLLAMHKAGIAHLDVKPSNVIMRNFWSGDKFSPVLVDFGLSGRRVRPGCGTANYAAPEIWGAEGKASDDPRPADVYAFGCLAYELLTGDVLFDAPTDVAIVTAHLSHDGSPLQIQAMHRDLSMRPLADMMTSCLRGKPTARATVGDLLRQLPFMRADLGSRPWPLAPSLQSLGRPLRAPRP